MKKKFTAITLSFILVFWPFQSSADVFGGDVVVLTQILAQAIETVIQLKQLLSTGTDTLNLLQDINAGVRSGLDLIHILNPRFNPGVYGDLRDPTNVLAEPWSTRPSANMATRH